MTVGELKEKLKNVSDDRIVAMYIDDDFGGSELEELDFGWETERTVNFSSEKKTYKYAILWRQF